MERGSDDGSLKSIEGVLACTAWLGQVPWVHRIHEVFRPYIGNHLAVNARHGSLFSIAVDAVKVRKEKGSDRRDILSKLFEVHKEKPEQLHDGAVFSVCASTILAGSDTTAVSIRSIIYEVLKHPACKARLLNEIDELYAGKGGSKPVTEEEADAMPYLQAVIYEGLRCHPVVGMNLPRVVPASGAEISGHFLPRGTVVGSSAWVIHRDRSVYGEDADEFNPDRWLGDKTSDMHRYFFTFGAGSRICLGRNISWMEMSKLIPTLFRHFDIELAYPDESPKEHAMYVQCAQIIMKSC